MVGTLGEAFKRLFRFLVAIAAVAGLPGQPVTAQGCAPRDFMAMALPDDPQGPLWMAAILAAYPAVQPGGGGLVGAGGGAIPAEGPTGGPCPPCWIRRPWATSSRSAIRLSGT